MKLVNDMCHSHLLWMLSNPREFEHSVISYSATTPEYQFEGMAGYIATKVTFEVKNLESFSKLYNMYHSLPSDIRHKWYHMVRNGCL